MKDLIHKTALITGGGTGIGLGIAQYFLEQGASVFIVGLDSGEIETAVESLSSFGQIEGWACDISDEAQIAGTVEKIENLDILVANAGSGMPGAILQMTEEHWSYVNSLNVTGTALCIKHAGLAMKARGGSIITISSVAATRPSTWMAAYSSSKAGVEMLTKVAAAELAGFNIRVNSIAPGLIGTEAVMNNLPEDFRDLTLKETLLGRYGAPKDVAQMASFLAGESSTFITGQIFAVDGGCSLHVQNYEGLARNMYGDPTIDDLISKSAPKAEPKSMALPDGQAEGPATGTGPANFDGEWQTSVKSPVGEQKGSMTIVTQGDTFTGKSHGSGATMTIENGKINGNKISWTLQLTKPVKMKIKGDATVTGDEMTGTLKLGMLGKSQLKGKRIS